MRESQGKKSRSKASQEKNEESNRSMSGPNEAYSMNTYRD